MAALTNRKTTVTEDQHAHHKRILKALLSDAASGNKNCADCHGRQPTWASVNLGIFVCLTCSGIHRSLGVHISQVRSTTLDTWTPEQVSFVRDVGGNVTCRGFWEAELDKHFVRPDGSDVHELKRFIVDKYCHRRYVCRDVREHVRHMSADEFSRYYPGEILRRARAGQGEGEGEGGDRAASAVHVTSPVVAVGGQPAPVMNAVHGGVADELLLLDVEDRVSTREHPEIAHMATEEAPGDDMWGDIDWISGEHPPPAERNAETETETETKSKPSTGVAHKKSIGDILALFDA